MAVTSGQIHQWLQQNPGASDAQIYSAMNQYGVTPEQMAQATGVPLQQVQQRYNAQGMTNQAQGIPTGLVGYERALQGGFEGSLDAIRQGMRNAQGNLTDQFNQGLAGLNQRTD